MSDLKLGDLVGYSTFRHELKLGIIYDVWYCQPRYGNNYKVHWLVIDSDFLRSGILKNFQEWLSEVELFKKVL
mgnify:CR=1 FL=1